MEELYRILEAVVTPIWVPLGAEGKLLKGKELGCSRNRGEASWGLRLALQESRGICAC